MRCIHNQYMSEIHIVKHTKFSHNKYKGNWNSNLQVAIANTKCKSVIMWAINDSWFSTKDE